MPADLNELLSNLVFFILAGHETTTNLIGNGIYILATKPDLFRELKSDKSLIPLFVEEVLRYESPVQLTSRVVTEECKYREIVLGKGHRVFGILGSANRDETIFDNPEVFNIWRTTNKKNLAFGAGSHFCLGSSLARLEAKLFFEQFLSQIDSLSPAEPAPVWSSNFSFRGLESFHVTVGR